MTQRNTRNLAKDELYKAVCCFVERQQLVTQAMLDMRLDLNAIGRFASLGWASSASTPDGQKPIDRYSKRPTNEIEQERYDALKYAEEIKVPRKGIWKDKLEKEWNYILHGGGCLLVNSKTQEPVDWDCPNPKAFDDSFFYAHLEWRLNQNENELFYIRELRSEIKSLFSELISDGLIQKCPMPMGLVYTLKDES